jgi:hypothetical protein
MGIQDQPRWYVSNPSPRNVVREQRMKQIVLRPQLSWKGRPVVANEYGIGSGLDANPNLGQGTNGVMCCGRQSAQHFSSCRIINRPRPPRIGRRT